MAQPRSIPQNDVNDLVRRAAGHHQRGELFEAEALYGQALARAPNNFDALHLYGVLLHQRGKSVEALKLIAKALKANAKAPAAHSNHSIVLAVLERYDEAVAACDRAIALKPDYAEAYNSRGNALARAAALRRSARQLRQGAGAAPGLSGSAQQPRQCIGRARPASTTPSPVMTARWRSPRPMPTPTSIAANVWWR